MRGDWAASIFAVLLVLAVLNILLSRIFQSLENMFDDFMDFGQTFLYVAGGLGGLSIAGYFALQIVKVLTAGKIEVSHHTVEIEDIKHKDEG
jgi:hypothetical protein